MGNQISSLAQREQELSKTKFEIFWHLITMVHLNAAQQLLQTNTNPHMNLDLCPWKPALRPCPLPFRPKWSGIFTGRDLRWRNVFPDMIRLIYLVNFVVKAWIWSNPFVPSVGWFCNQLENQIDQFGSAETSMLKNMYDNYKYTPNTDHFNFTSCTLQWFQFRKDVIIHLDVGTVPVWNFRGYFKSKLWYPEPCHA
jgi:hypothetical protein